jgi:hypothetical protein
MVSDRRYRSVAGRRHSHLPYRRHVKELKHLYGALAPSRMLVRQREALRGDRHRALDSLWRGPNLTSFALGALAGGAARNDETISPPRP